MSNSQTTLLEKDPSRWMVLGSVIAAALTTVLDGALMGLIAPAVKADLGADTATIGLISSVGMLMLSAFILGGGTLGDIYGRKRFLTYGLIGLGITSILSMLVPNAGLLVPVRALAGIMAALVNPLALAIIMVTFDNQERPKAIGLYGASMGIVGGLGTLIIAFLNGRFGWRSTFGLILALAVIAFLMVGRFVKENKASGSKRVDWAGILLIAVGLFGIVFGINQAGVAGLNSSKVLVPVGIGVVVLVILVQYSKRAKDPALELSLFQNKIFSVGVLLGVLTGFAGGGAFFQISSYLQALQKIPPFQAALTMLPYTLALFVFAILSGGWVGKYTNQVLITGGLVAMAVGVIVMGFFLSPSAGFWVYLLPFIFMGGGQSTVNTPRVSAVLGSAPAEFAGSASATNNASVQLGGSLGIAVMGALFGGLARNTYFADLAEKGLDQATIDKSVEVLSAWLKANSGDVAAQFGITIQHLEGVIAEYQHAFTSGVSQVLWMGAGVLLVGAVLAWFTFQNKGEK